MVITPLIRKNIINKSSTSTPFCWCRNRGTLNDSTVHIHIRLMKRKESLYTCCLGESDAARIDNYASDSSISYRGMKYYSFFFSSEYYIYVCNEGEQSQINQAKKGWMHHLRSLI